MWFMSIICLAGFAVLASEIIKLTFKREFNSPMWFMSIICIAGFAVLASQIISLV